MFKYIKDREKQGCFTSDGKFHFDVLKYTVYIMTINFILAILSLVISIIK